MFAFASIGAVVNKKAENEQIIQSTTETVVSTIQTNTSVVESTTELTTTTTSTTQPTTEKTKTTTPTKATATKPTNKVTQTYSKDDLYVLSHIINAEAGGESDECQLAVGSVVLNRVNHKSFPNTIYGVVFQKGQYSPTWNGSYYKTPTDRAVKNAKYLLENGSILPPNVVYQAQFVQGTVYKKIGTEYFCYG